MWRSPSLVRNGPDTLEAYAERAGAALACAYSNSAEFDAALIAERRAAGVYGPRRHRKQMLATILLKARCTGGMVGQKVSKANIDAP